jgi:hypothetical protein
MKKNKIRFILAIVFVCAFTGNSATDNVAPSQNPPNDLPVSNVPQFLIFGYDDQETVQGMQAVIDIFKQRKNPKGLGQKATFDGAPLRCSFYSNGCYMDNSTMKNLHKQALADGFEIGNHTYSHTTGFNTSESTWKSEMQQCNTTFISAGVPTDSIFGFRTPFLEYNNATFRAMVSMGIIYDCSIEEGWEKDQTVGLYFWPHTLDNGSPGNKAMIELNQPYELLTAYPGLWEIPCYNVILPHDSICGKYGISIGLRTRTYNNINYFDVTNGKLTGLDYNLIEEAQVTANELLSILKYNLDMNYSGNRAPMTFGSHSKYYSESQWARVLEDFLDYALEYPDIRIITTINLIRWMRNPTPLDTNMTLVTNDVSRMNTATTFCIKALPHRIIQISGLTSGAFEAVMFTMKGEKIASVSKSFSQGISNSALFSASSVSAGVIIVSVQTNRLTFARKVQLLD